MWKAGTLNIKATKTISLDAGSQLNRIETSYIYNSGVPLPVVVGITKRQEVGTLLLNETNGIMGYWEPEHQKNGITGIGCIIQYPIKRMSVNKEQILAETQSAFNKSFVHYAGASWNKAGEITSADEWFNYLSKYKKSLDIPLIINFKLEK